MKTITSLVLGAAILTMAALNLSAGNVVLSPRAAANQIKIVPTVMETVVVPTAGPALLSPRAAANQIASVSGSEATLAKCPVVGSPKYLAVAGDSAPTVCCGMSVGKCSAMTACAKVN